MVKVGIVGGTGYTGVELLRLLAQHPQAEVVAITSRSEAGLPVADLYPNLRGHYDGLAFSVPDTQTLAACDVCVVTNSVCGHPRPGEDLDAAVHRRARDELGIAVRDVRLVLPGFRYRAVMSGIVEHELCPVFVARFDSSTGSGADTGTPDDRVTADPAEVGEVSWLPWERFRADATAGAIATLSPWCREQVEALAALGDDPSDWPTADPALLPPAATLSAQPSHTRP